MKPLSANGRGVRDATEMELRPWGEVAREFSARTGERMTRRQAVHLGRTAVRKIRAAWVREPRSES